MYNKHFLFEANENIQNMFFCPQKILRCDQNTSRP